MTASSLGNTHFGLHGAIGSRDYPSQARDWVNFPISKKDCQNILQQTRKGLSEPARRTAWVEKLTCQEGAF